MHNWNIFAAAGDEAALGYWHTEHFFDYGDYEKEMVKASVWTSKQGTRNSYMSSLCSDVSREKQKESEVSSRYKSDANLITSQSEDIQNQIIAIGNYSV